MIRIEKASNEAIKYACKYFHYAGHHPTGNMIGYSVFENDEWCGVVIFGSGATPNIGKPYGLKQGEIMELTRMALNGKQTTTSQVMMACVKQLKKDAPLCKLLVSYADIDQNHLGIIYQATNWIYTGETTKNKVSAYIINGRKIHNRNIMGYRQRIPHPKDMSVIDFVRKYLDPNGKEFITKGKQKYLMPLDKKLRKSLMQLSKPYPKIMQ